LALTLWNVPTTPRLKDAPEAFNRVGVDRADNVLVRRVADDGMRVLFIEAAIANPLVSDQQADFLGNRAAHEGFEEIAANRADDAGNDLPLRSTAPTMGVLPDPMPPRPEPPRLSQCRFFALPPTKVSSTSTIPRVCGNLRWRVQRATDAPCTKRFSENRNPSFAKVGGR